MQIGDLVKLKGVHHPNRSRLGIVVRDRTMMCSHATTTPYRMGEVEVLWNDGATLAATYANLEPIKKINKKSS